MKYILLFFTFFFALSTFGQEETTVPEGYTLKYTARVVRTDIPAMSESNINAVISTLQSAPLTKTGKQLLKSLKKLPKQLEEKGYELKSDRAILSSMVASTDAWTSPLTVNEIEWQKKADVAPWTDTYDIIGSIFKNEDTISDKWAFVKKIGRIAIVSKELFGDDDKISSFLSEEDIRTVSEQYNEEMWRSAGPSPDNYAFTLESAAYNWMVMQNDLQNAIKGNADSIKVYPLSTDKMMRLISLIGFNNYSDEQVNDLRQFLPVNATFELRLYTKDSKNIVKMMLNGKEKRTFGTPREMTPYQQWRMFRSYMAKRIRNNNLHREMYTMGDGRIFEPNGMIVWTPIFENGQFKGIHGSHPTENGDYGGFTMYLTLGDNARIAEKHPDLVSIASDDAQLDMTGMAHTGFFRLKNKEAKKITITIVPDSAGYIQTDTINNGIFGYTTVNGRTGKNGFHSCFGFEFMTPMTEYGIKGNKAWVTFDLADNDELLIKTANSFVNKKGLLYNFAQEIPHWEFNDTRMRNVGAWELRMRRKLFRKTLTKDNKQEKLNELYSMSILPRQISDKNGRYPSFGDGSKIMVKSLGKFGNRPIYEKVFGDFPLNEGKAVWDYQRQTNDIFNVFEQSLKYKEAETKQ